MAFAFHSPPLPLAARSLFPAPATSSRRRVRRVPIAPRAVSTTTDSATPPSAAPQEPSPRLRSFLSKAREGDPLKSLARAEAAFAALKARALKPATPPSLVTTTDDPVLASSSPSGAADFDVVIAGGTLGIIYATALQRLGWRVAVVERGPLQGRRQEWNISRDELAALVRCAVLTEQQLEECVSTEWNSPGRIAFALEDASPMRELKVSDVLNVGVSPERLVELAAANFRDAGGVVLDSHQLTAVRVGPDAARLSLLPLRTQAVPGAQGAGGTGLAAAAAATGTGSGGRGSGSDDAEDAVTEVVVTTRLLIDAMGSFSPIGEQARGGRAPDGVCITVGSCMRADFDEPVSLDVIVSDRPVDAARSTQYFWEAFPVGGQAHVRTTYMFAYGACDPRRATLTDALEDYVRAVAGYQGVDIEEAEVIRVLFGFFPSYFRDCPTRVAFDRVLPVGDAGGLQSPISFGGFGCCLRHLQRITDGVNEVLLPAQRNNASTIGGQGAGDFLLKREMLQGLQWYLPSLSVTGLFHRAMSVAPGEKTGGPLMGLYGINQTLWANMAAMNALGKDVQLPFLRDVVTAGGLSKTLAAMMVRDPVLALRLPVAIGAPELAGWLRHFVALVVYAAGQPGVKAFGDWVDSNNIGDEQFRFWVHRAVDAAYYGSGADAIEEIIEKAR